MFLSSGSQFHDLFTFVRSTHSLVTTSSSLGSLHTPTDDVKAKRKKKWAESSDIYDSVMTRHEREFPTRWWFRFEVFLPEFRPLTVSIHGCPILPFSMCSCKNLTLIPAIFWFKNYPAISQDSYHNFPNKWNEVHSMLSLKWLRKISLKALDSMRSGGPLTTN